MKHTLTAPTAPISTATDGVFDRLFLTPSLRAQALSFFYQTNALLTNQHFSVKISPELKFLILVIYLYATPNNVDALVGLLAY